MKINSGSIAMSSNRSYEYSSATTESTITGYHQNGVLNQTVTSTVATVSQFEAEGSTSLFSCNSGQTERTDKNEISVKNNDSKQENQDTLRQTPARHLQNIGSVISALPDISEDPKIVMLKRMLSMLENANKAALPTFNSSKSSKALFFGASLKSAGISLFSNTSGASQPQTANGYWTKQVVASGFEEGAENTAFSSVGDVVTSDGRTISFGITVEMSRSFASEFSFAGEEEAFVMTDPLVINLETDSAEIADTTFFFDLDSDGESEEMANLAQGSGFLALDKNQDGAINNGSELFGTKSGDGFAELAQYDEDKNGWIDENDKVFSRLSVWTKTPDGKNELLALSQAGVGAIFLGNQSTQFTLADSSQNEGAQIRSTGVFLHENGSVGTIQHIDFKV